VTASVRRATCVCLYSKARQVEQSDNLLRQRYDETRLRIGLLTDSVPGSELIIQRQPRIQCSTYHVPGSVSGGFAVHERTGLEIT